MTLLFYFIYIEMLKIKNYVNFVDFEYGTYLILIQHSLLYLIT